MSFPQGPANMNSSYFPASSYGLVSMLLTTLCGLRNILRYSQDIYIYMLIASDQAWRLICVRQGVPPRAQRCAARSTCCASFLWVRSGRRGAGAGTSRHPPMELAVLKEEPKIVGYRFAGGSAPRTPRWGAEPPRPPYLS